MMTHPLLLPSPLQHWLETTADRFTYTMPDDKALFLAPAGAPALVPPDSVSWMVFKNPVTLLIGGVAAVILELGEPRVRDGVWHHTSFRQDPVPRLRRTGLAAMMTVYGPRQQVESMTRSIAGMHARVQGVTEEGLPYRADDPELLDWVHTTASFGFLQAYRHHAAPLDEADCDRFYAEGVRSALLYGASGGLTSVEKVQSLFADMAGKLRPSPVVFEFLHLMRRAPLLPLPLRGIQRLLIAAAVDIVPLAVRSKLGLDARHGLHPWQRIIVRRLAATADRLLLRSSPAALSCRRLGLPEDYLYRRA